MVSPATGSTLVFNGEIYNFQDIRAELQAVGAQFITNGDTEVILHGYDRWGVDIFARLRGMFALVLVDPRNARVVMARDGYGIKPLYWTRFAGAEVGLRLPSPRRACPGPSQFCGTQHGRAPDRAISVERVHAGAAHDLEGGPGGPPRLLCSA